MHLPPFQKSSVWLPAQSGTTPPPAFPSGTSQCYPSLRPSVAYRLPIESFILLLPPSFARCPTVHGRQRNYFLSRAQRHDKCCGCRIRTLRRRASRPCGSTTGCRMDRVYASLSMRALRFTPCPKGARAAIRATSTGRWLVSSVCRCVRASLRLMSCALCLRTIRTVFYSLRTIPCPDCWSCAEGRQKWTMPARIRGRISRPRPRSCCRMRCARLPSLVWACARSRRWIPASRQAAAQDTGQRHTHTLDRCV